jgi:hypothetical protein
MMKIILLEQFIIFLIFLILPEEVELEEVEVKVGIP